MSKKIEPDAFICDDCGDCGTRFLRDGSADGDSNRCPDCSRFAAKVADHGCPECGEGELVGLVRAD